MVKLLKVVFTGVVFSCYYFPFEFVFLPGINTKMMLAVIGVALFVQHYITDNQIG